MSVTATSNPAAKPKRDLIPDHMAGWPNDDLLLEEPARIRVEAEWPGALRVFKWDGLRTLFEQFDQEAGKSRKNRQRAGFLAVLTAGLGSAFSAGLPMFGDEASREVFVTAALLSATGLVWCLVLAIADPDKAAWLQHRLRTERLRQFYFQFMGADPALAIAAFSDDKAFAQWETKRAKAQTLFEAWLHTDMRDELANVIRDVNHRHVWQVTAWEVAPPAPAASPELDAYFRIMRKQRIGIQNRYVSRKLEHGFGSPLTRHIANQALSYALAIMTMALSAFSAWLVSKGMAVNETPISELVSLIALLGVVSIFLKVMADGQQLKAEVERFQWYQQAIEDVDAQFNNPDPAARIRALRDMEHVSYRELRDFLKTHNDSRFSFG